MDSKDRLDLPQIVAPHRSSSRLSLSSGTGDQNKNSCSYLAMPVAREKRCLSARGSYAAPDEREPLQGERNLRSAGSTAFSSVLADCEDDSNLSSFEN
mmetsp:Transcript_20838/g.28759  ORF Transcript_20838/g.28759 Transcript_20838/m.28759 type:complete len:98 (+) Transcript_20838:119-412(+)